ncbi:BglG family transcription antiterminator [Raineyella sp. LH-20]|uniref:BglG family transcription antiterminator n=1 Tax=Raineyella sp. LH-20 TaxID=3081204 RepID=UPI002954AC5C|nr:PTS sugar transporter subunit IIA [Raineyella sp. LH-20]WOP19398.1 PTS sugar transporter subunit IIA [Raineyella sp. LH-20]
MIRDRRRALLDLLLRSAHPLSGEDLAARLQVSPRTVRNDVRDLNRAGRLVVASHHGYSLDREAYEAAPESALAEGLHAASGLPDTPDRRLRYLCRNLVQNAEPISIHTLADRLMISESTLESDLGRVRELMRQHDLTLRRDHDLVLVVGPERSRRRLVRQLLHNSTQGLMPATWQAFAAEYDHIDIDRLRDTVQRIIGGSPLQLNEFALRDVLVHLTITIDRVRQGHTLPAADWVPPYADAHVRDLTQQLADAVATDLGTVLPETELRALYGVVAVRATRNATPEAAETAVDPQLRTVVAEILDDVSTKYLLGPADPAMLLNVALHAQNLIARARSDLSLVNPLGENFKNEHPLVHDLAIYFAQRLEERTGIAVGPGEVDYLSMHMGMQYLRYLEQRDLVTVTLVVPRYYDLADSLAERLGRKLRGQADIERVVTSLDFDFAEVTSDLIVSCVDPAGPASAPVIRIGPFLTSADLDLVIDGVRRERERNARRRVRTVMSTLIDPQAYFHVPEVATKEAALAMMCERMADLGYVDPGFLDDVLDRERRSATSFGGEFAIPHSMYMDAHSTAISVLACDRGIPWGSSADVRLVFLFALSPDGRQTFRDALDELTRLLSEPARIAALIDGAQDSDGFLATLLSLVDA